MSARAAAERFWEKVEPTGFCWEWTASLDKHGHGQFMATRGKCVRAHRFAYEELVGPIPVGLVLDHLCRNRACVNPDHLDPVTNHENTKRGRAGYNTPKLGHCRKDASHVFPEHAQTRRNGTRYCKTCANAAARLKYTPAAERIAA